MDTELLRRVLSTLDTIPVTGKDNLDKMLGCMHVIESIIRVEEVKSKEKSENEEEVVDNG